MIFKLNRIDCTISKAKDNNDICTVLLLKDYLEHFFLREAPRA